MLFFIKICALVLGQILCISSRTAHPNFLIHASTQSHIEWNDILWRYYGIYGHNLNMINWAIIGHAVQFEGTKIVLNIAHTSLSFIAIHFSSLHAHLSTPSCTTWSSPILLTFSFSWTALILLDSPSCLWYSIDIYVNIPAALFVSSLLVILMIVQPSCGFKFLFIIWFLPSPSLRI